MRNELATKKDALRKAAVKLAKLRAQVEEAEKVETAALIAFFNAGGAASELPPEVVR